MAVTRNLKSQMEADNKRVFLNTDEFAMTDTILYFRDGDMRPPIEYHIPHVVEDDDADMLKTWNKQQSYQLSSNEQIVMQKGKVLYVALEDLQEVPKRRRYMQVGKIRYEISSVENEAGMIKIKLRVLDE